MRFAALSGSGGGVTSAALLWSLGAVGAAGLGLWLRSLDARRLRAVREVRRAERLDLARDLHDEVAQALKEIEAAGTQALLSMRRTVSTLRDIGGSAGREPGHGLPDVPDLVARFPGARLTMGPNLDPPAATAATAYRVVLEALTNVRRHGREATAVEVHIGVVEATLRVVVTDNGSGPAGPRREGFGLIGLTERVTAVGGTLSAGPRSTSGWRVEATLPLEETG